jgi:hypothetical protein
VDQRPQVKLLCRGPRALKARTRRWHRAVLQVGVILLSPSRARASHVYFVPHSPHPPARLFLSCARAFLRLSSSSFALYEVRNTCAQPPCDPSRNHPAHPHAVAIPPPKHAELIALGIGFADFTPWRLALPLGPMCVVFHGGWSETALSCPTLYAMPRLIHPSPKPPAPQPMQ